MAEKEKAAESQAKKKQSLPKNCAKCNTRIKRRDWLYRDNAYYCGKGCAADHKAAKAEEAAKKAAQAPASGLEAPKA